MDHGEDLMRMMNGIDDDVDACSTILGYYSFDNKFSARSSSFFNAGWE